jgi:hypothetical protein
MAAMPQAEVVVVETMDVFIVPPGVAIALTAHKWDYASLAARLIPNRFHPWIVHHTEGRAEEDVFPTVYTARYSFWRRSIRNSSSASGHSIASRAGSSSF